MKFCQDCGARVIEVEDHYECTACTGRTDIDGEWYTPEIGPSPWRDWMAGPVHGPPTLLEHKLAEWNQKYLDALFNAVADPNCPANTAYIISGLDAWLPK